MKAIVIGAGVVGSAVAFRLAEAGVGVTLIDGDRVGGGTSGISFAWINANNKPPRPYHDLNVAGMKAHAAVAREFGSAPWYHESGSIEWRRSPEDRAAHKARVERLRSWGYEVEWLSKSELGALEPDIDLDRVDGATISLCPREGWIDPVVYANAMTKRAIALGAALVTGSAVVEILTGNGAVRGVRTEDGAEYAADVVVNCAGRWADRVTTNPDLLLPLAPTVGFIVFTPPVATSVSHLVHAPELHFRPDGAGRLMLRENAFDHEVTLATEPGPALPQALEVMRRAAALLPALARVRPEAARIAARPIPRDGLSAIGPMPKVRNCYAVITHSGVTLSPYLARAVTDEIVRGQDHPELARFRPSRFFN